MRKLNEECGVFAIYGDPKAAVQTKLGLYTLQHRGQESCGIAVTNHQGDIIACKGMGMVMEVLTQSVTDKLPGSIAIGHTRYSTQGGSTEVNAQPFAATVWQGKFAVGHNGTITNAAELRLACEANGAVFQSTSDTEVILHLVAQSRQPKLLDAIIEALNCLEGAFSLVFLTKDSIIAARDSNGFRPLVIGQTDAGFVVASETCAFQYCKASYIGEIKPGEIAIVSASGLKRFQFTEPRILSQCVFEHIYFARPNSTVFGLPVSQTRKEFGRLLAEVLPVEADIVVGVPNSGLYAGFGYAEKSGIPFELGITRGPSSPRSFIQPSQELRIDAILLKLCADSALLENKKVILVDDSIVRGNTSRKIVRLVREAGAKEVHMRISSPMLVSQCFHGVDIPSREELIAYLSSVNSICESIEANSLAFLPLKSMLQAVGDKGYCSSCFTGKYPTMAKNLIQIS